MHTHHGTLEPSPRSARMCPGCSGSRAPAASPPRRRCCCRRCCARRARSACRPAARPAGPRTASSPACGLAGWSLQRQPEAGSCVVTFNFMAAPPPCPCPPEGRPQVAPLRLAAHRRLPQVQHSTDAKPLQLPGADNLLGRGQGAGRWMQRAWGSGSGGFGVGAHSQCLAKCMRW